MVHTLQWKDLETGNKINIHKILKNGNFSARKKIMWKCKMVRRRKIVRLDGQERCFWSSFIWAGPRDKRAFLVAQTVKNPSAVQETWVRSLGWEDPLEKGMATHSSILAWRIPMNRGAWQATVHRFANSGTWLKRLSMYEGDTQMAFLPNK